MSRPVGTLVKRTDVDSIEDIKFIPKRTHMIDFRYKIPLELFEQLEMWADKTGLHRNELISMALEAFFRRKGKK